jgi:subtilisin family serine protease
VVVGGWATIRPGLPVGEAASAALAPGADSAIVVKLRRPIDARALLSARLAPAIRGSRAWTPRLGRPFARRAARLGRESFDHLYVSDLPAGIDVDDALARLARDPNVEYAQRDFVRETHEAIYEPFYQSTGSWGQPYDDLWSLKKLQLEQAWDIAKGGAVVAVVDSGIDRTHPELESQVLDQVGWDFVSNDNDPSDEFGHGTHMAGIVAARHDNLGTVGVAPGARLMAVRAIRGAGAGTSSTIAAGIVYAADNGANVILVSSGCITRCPSDPLVESAVRHAAASGALVVVSAGNRGDNVGFYSPQNMTDPRPIVVAASTQLDGRASFGNGGELVDLVAPGGGTNAPPPSFEPVSNILSLASSVCAPIICRPEFLVGGSDYLRRQGTSMAAAHVAGVAALLFDAEPFDDVDVVRERLFGNALDLGPRGHDAMFGWGRLRGMDAVADVRRYILARITSPAQGQVVRGSVRIIGAAAARTFDRYEVAVGAGAAPTSWQTSGVTLVGHPTAQGDLARWNTDGLAPGAWTIRLVVHDTIGGWREYRRAVQVETPAAPAQLVLDVASERRGTGLVDVSPVRPFCSAVAAATQTCTYSEPAGTSLTLTAVAEGPSTFMGWSGDCSGTDTCTVQITRLHNVRAVFLGPFQLRTKLRQLPGGYGSIGLSDETPPDGACGDSCYLFQANRVARVWKDDGPASTTYFDACGGRECEVTMDRNHLIEATTLRVDHPEIPWSYPPGDQRVPAGTPSTLSGFIGTNLWGPVFPVTVNWFDANSGELLGTSQADFPYASVEITVRFDVGVRTVAFSAADSGDPPNFTFHTFRVITHEP